MFLTSIWAMISSGAALTAADGIATLKTRSFLKAFKMP
jgi:hypothetical protein